MTFLEPNFLWLAPVAILLGAALYLWSRKLRRARLANFATVDEAAAILKSPLERNRMVRFILAILGLVLLAVALARPATGPKSAGDEQDVIDVLIALDVSLSMNTEDVKPSRLGAARAAITEWLGEARNVRVGVILFSGQAFLQMPFTTDLGNVRLLVEAANSRGAGVGGSDFGKAIETAIVAFDRAGGTARPLIIISDGETTMDDSTSEVLSRASVEHHIRIYTIGVGTAAGGEVPLIHPDGKRIGVAKNKYGATVISRLDSGSLREMATQTGGSYLSLQDNPHALRDLQERRLSQLARETRKVDATDYDEWFQIPLTLSLLLLFLEPLIGTVLKRRERSAAPAAIPAAVSALVGLLLICTTAHAEPGRDQLQTIQSKLSSGQAAEARASMESLAGDGPRDSRTSYNLGVAAYATGDFPTAAGYFEQALASADEKLAGSVLFQLGNAQARIAEGKIQSGDNAGGTLDLERALENFDRSPGSKGRRNRAVALTYFTDVLEEMGDNFVQLAVQAKGDDWTEMRNLTKAVGSFEKILEYEKDNKPVQEKLMSAKISLSDNRERDARKELEIGKGAYQQSPKGAYVSMNKAMTSAETAIELNPENSKARETLEEVKKEWSKMHTGEANKRIVEAGQQAKPQRKLDLFEVAATSAEDGVNLDPDNAEAKDALKRAHDGIEKTAVEVGDQLVTDAAKSKSAKGKSSALTTALERFQRAVDLNPENEYAKKRVEEVKPLLARAMEEMGKSELEAAKGTLANAGPQDSPANLQTAMDQLGMADHGFSEAKALGNDSKELGEMQAEARKLAGEVQQRIDALAAAMAPGGTEGGTTDMAEGTAQSADEQPMEMKSFSDIRSVGAGGNAKRPDKYW